MERLKEFIVFQSEQKYLSQPENNGFIQDKVSFEEFETNVKLARVRAELNAFAFGGK